jgi:hypothetical protein
LKAPTLVFSLDGEWTDLPPGKLNQLKLEFSRNLNGRTQDEEEPLHGKANHWDFEAARDCSGGCWFSTFVHFFAKNARDLYSAKA